MRGRDAFGPLIDKAVKLLQVLGDLGYFRFFGLSVLWGGGPDGPYMSQPFNWCTAPNDPPTVLRPLFWLIFTAAIDVFL